MRLPHLLRAGADRSELQKNTKHDPAIVQHRLADSDLSDIMKATGQSNLFDGVLIESHVLRDRGGEMRHALRMPAQVHILCLECVDERFDDIDAQPS